MNIPGKKAIHKSIRWLRSRFVNHALILGYHRIAEVSQGPYSMCVTPENFYEQMQVLRNYASPLSVKELVNGLIADNLPPRAVALTFDDGYADILYNAKPILEELHIPATAFVVSGNMGEEFWWDELGRMILGTTRTTGELRMRVNTQEYKWDLSDTLDHTQRYSVVLSIYRVLRRVPESLRQKQLEQIRIWASGSPNSPTKTRCLTSEELGSLTEGGLIDIGAHGISHTDLSMLSPTQYESEIKTSKEHLERILGKHVRCFSYPNGICTQEIKATVKKANYHYACASFNDVAWRGSDLFALPRYWITDINGRQFYRWLKIWT